MHLIGYLVGISSVLSLCWIINIEEVVIFVLDLASSANVGFHVVWLFSLVIWKVEITLRRLWRSDLWTVRLSIIDQRQRSCDWPHIVVYSIVKFLRKNLGGISTLECECFSETKGISDAKNVKSYRVLATKDDVMVAAARIGFRRCPWAKRIPLVDGLVLKLAQKEEKQPCREVLKHGQCLILTAVHKRVNIH